MKMEGKCIIQWDEVYTKPCLGTEVETVAAKVKTAVVAAAESLGVGGNFKMTRSWLVEIDKADRPAFIELAREMLECL
jgi:hypothetical protein